SAQSPIQPTTAVQFQKNVPSQFAQKPAARVIPNFYEKEIPEFDEVAAESSKPSVFTETPRELERAAVVSIELEALEKPAPAPAAVAKQESSPYMRNLQQTSGTVPSIANSMVAENIAQAPARSNTQIARRSPRIAGASMVEDWTEERIEDLPPMESVGAWFGYNMYPADNCPPMPEWKFRAEALYWHRSDPEGGDPLLIRVPAMAPPGSYIANDVDYDNELGHRYRLERMNNDGSGFDMEYFGVNDWSDTVRWVDEQIFVLGTDIGAGSAAISSDSEFHSWEINGRREWDPWTTFFAGFRYMNLDEYTGVSGAGDVQNVFASIDVSNNLYGVQLGLDRTLFDNGGVLTVDMSFNLGVFYNSIDAQTVNFPTGFDTEEGAASLLRELNFNMNLAVTDHISLVGGYTLIWLDDLALGPDQFRPGVTTIDESSNIFVHGGNLGLQFVW
ncbi:MAG: hypothetical protein CMJ46_02705, partial [Planctomyces sp.]|nr:hypothetical protein [Planctomyces sp.]